MSLEPRWYSTIYEAILIVGQALSALALAIAGLALLGGGRRLSDAAPSKAFVDMGNLLLAFVMLWAYVSFSQYLIVWSGGLPEEIAWYLRRQSGAWRDVALALAGAQFALPFLLLLPRGNKARLDRLAGICALLLAARALEVFWLVKPAFAPPAAAPRWLDAAAALCVGGAWLGSFLGGLLARAPLAAVAARREAP
jgi:hypothetical protein